MRTLIVVALLLLGSAARAQPDVGPVFSSLSLNDALAESIRTHKVLVVAVRGNGPAHGLMEETTWKNPTLAAWIKWHAIAVRLDRREDPAGYQRFLQLVRGAVAGDTNEFPHIFFFVRGNLAGAYPDKRWHGYFFENPLNFQDGGPNPQVFYPKAVQLLLHLDLLMDRTRAKDPMWFMLHEQHNPPPPPPEVPLLCFSEDGDAPAVRDPEPGSGEDVLTRLDQARRHVAAREYFDATGLYTWLFERGPVLEPAFRPYANTFMLADMAALADQRDATRTRFLNLRKNLEIRQPWWTYTDLLDWIRFSEAMKMEGQVLTYIASYTLDDQEATMIPPCDRAAYTLLERREPLSDPRQPSAHALAALRARAPTVNSTQRPTGVDHAEWANVITLRQRLFFDEACRLHAAYLLRGDLHSAAEAAALLLAARDDAEARLALVMTAAAAGAPPAPDHARWVREARLRGVTSPALDRLFPEAP